MPAAVVGRPANRVITAHAVSAAPVVGETERVGELPRRREQMVLVAVVVARRIAPGHAAATVLSLFAMPCKRRPRSRSRPPRGVSLVAQRGQSRRQAVLGRAQSLTRLCLAPAHYPGQALPLHLPNPATA